MALGTVTLRGVSRLFPPQTPVGVYGPHAFRAGDDHAPVGEQLATATVAHDGSLTIPRRVDGHAVGWLYANVDFEHRRLRVAP